MIMDKNSHSYSIHNKANAFTGNVVDQLNHDIAKGMCIAFHLQPIAEARVWKELTHGGMKLNSSDDQIDNGCHEILWNDSSKDVMHKVLADCQFQGSFKCALFVNNGIPSLHLHVLKNCGRIFFP